MLLSKLSVKTILFIIASSSIPRISRPTITYRPKIWNSSYEKIILIMPSYSLLD